ncbi:cupin domain-containing protein [Streptomyces sp. QL37]|uniref:cupin domain-containing protein n=1 Tax=Streptomyces sp. QL37 TaxID=2093747 RepID=UPI000CF2FB18|nr:cupin domain-containing protein [Streptomyces sp. QL37]PPQ61984.1 cupin domain-containing protein [Streptomyces sp. QL37]
MTLFTHEDASHLGVPGQAESVTIGTNTCTMLIPTEATHDGFGLYSLAMPPHGPFASPHFHKEMTEVFIVRTGQVQLLRGNEYVTADAGSALYVPPGTPHGFANVGEDPAELLIAFMPGRHREGFFRGMAELIQEDQVPPTQEQLTELAERYDQYRYLP